MGALNHMPALQSARQMRLEPRSRAGAEILKRQARARPRKVGIGGGVSRIIGGYIPDKLFKTSTRNRQDPPIPWVWVKTEPNGGTAI